MRYTYEFLPQTKLHWLNFLLGHGSIFSKILLRRFITLLYFLWLCQRHFLGAFCTESLMFCFHYRQDSQATELYYMATRCYLGMPIAIW